MARTSLAAYLKKHDITMASFALEMGVSVTTISRIAAGERKPGRELALKILRRTNGAVPVDAYDAPTIAAAQ